MDIGLGDAGILIMSKDAPPDKMTDLNDSRLTFIQGDPTNRLDLDRCFICAASTTFICFFQPSLIFNWFTTGKIIILSNPYFNDDDREGADSSTIMTHLDVHKLAPNAQIFTELVHEPNLKFFRKDQVLGIHPSHKKRILLSF